MKSKLKNAKSPPSGDKKKDTVKNGKKTVRGKNKGMFAKDNQPENKGRPKGSKDAKYYFDISFKGDSKQKVANEIVEILQDAETPQQIKVSLLKLLTEYLFERPTQNISTETKEPLKIEVNTQEQANAIKEMVKAK